MSEIKVLFPESGWKMRLERIDSRVEIRLYWRGKVLPTHVAAIDVADLEKLVGPK